MSVHYKFKSALSFDTITFDGLHISVRDLKKSILQQKQIGKSTDFDLQITNAQSNEVYEDENVLIPKNSSLIVVRVPLTSQQKKNWEKNETLPVLNNNKLYNSDSQDPFVNRLAKTVDLANVDASEGDKIQAAITQSTLDYDPSNYLRIKGSNQVGELPANYRCYKCMQPGHWIKDCKLNAQQDAIEIKKSTGIPRSFMVPVEGPQVPGAMMTPTGQFAVPTIEHEARREPIRKPLEPALLEKPQIPDDLLCGVCKDLLVDAVLIPCCGNSFCDECIRNVLLESEEHQCPDCKEKDVSPDTLIPNRFLRNSVNNFKNQTGYIRTAHPPTPRQPGVRRPPVTNTSLVTIQVSSPRKASPPVPASPDATEPVITPDDIVLVSEERSRDRDDERRERRQPPLGNAIPELGSEQESLYPPHHRHPLHHHSSRHTTNTNICPQGEDKPHRHKEPPPGYISHQRGDRSGTPTVDERSNERYHQVHTIPPGMEHHQQPPRGPPPHGYHQPRGGNMMYNRGPAFAGNRPPMPPYNNFPPGTGPPPMRGAPPYRGRPRAPFTRDRPSHHNTEILPKGPIDDPLSEFNRIMKEKDAKKQARRHGRSHSRSPLPPLKGGRSYSRSRSPRSRTRSRSPLPLVRRSPRSRSRTRASSRTRSPRSRTPPSLRLRPVRRRSRSRSFTISRSSSRSPRRSRSWASRSPSRDRRERDRDHSPKRRLDYRPASPLRASPPTRYYSKGYKESYSSSGRDSQPSSRNGRGGRFHSSKPVDTFYSTDYSRENERFERGGSGRERERDRFDRYETRDRIERPAERDKDRERDRGEKERDRERERKERFERLDRERERGLPEKEREREREPHREREREKESDRSYAPYKRYDEPTRDYDHPPFRDMAREWEKTRDREIEMREKERQSEYYRKRELKGNPVETIETLREPIGPPGVFEERDRVVIDLPVRSELPEKLRTPEKEKKSKEKKKKKKEDSEKKKKKKRLKEKAEKKEEPLEEGEIVESKSEPDTTTSEKKDDLYGDLGANVDQFVVENYNKPPPSPPVEEQKDTLLEEEKDVMLAPVPELSKWEKEEDNPNLISMKFEDDAGARDAEGKQVTSEILERAMNVITKRNVKPPEKTVEKKEEVKDPVRREREVTKDSEVEKTKERERFREREPEKKRERDLEKSKERESERSREIPREERTRDIPRDERSRDVPREERSRDVPREERSRDVPREERSRDVPREERTRDIPRDERSRDVPREERSRDVPRDERSRDVPREERSRDVPRDERSRDVPRDERSREVPRERSKERERDRERGRDRERERDRGERGRSRDRDRTERERERREREERERHQPRSVALPVKTEPAERKRSSSRSRTSSDTRPRISAKERLGAKVDDQVFVKRDVRVERREVKLEKLTKSMIHKDRDEPVQIKPQRRVIEGKPSDSKSPGKDAPVIQEAKVTSLEELPPDLINPEGDKEEKNVKKRSVSEEKAPEPKKAKVDVEEKGSTEDSSLSSDDSEDRSHKKKKKKKHKKKKKKRRHSSSSDSDSDTSSSPSESEKKKKKHKHKSHKKSKKKKKSKK